MDTDVIYNETDIDFLNYTNRVVEEENMVRDLAFEEMEENCFRLTIKDLKTGKKVLNLVTEQITMDQEFDFELQQDVMTLTILLSDEYVAENGDTEYMEE